MLETPIVHRTAVRLLVLDEQDKMLLLQYHTPDTGEEFWCTPGGAIDGGESHQAAARRELHEETGWAGDLDIGPVVWQRVHEFRIGDGRLFRQQERYHRVRLRHYAPHAARLSDFEASAVVGARWWTLAELQRTDATLQPPELAALFEGLLRPPRAGSR